MNASTPDPAAQPLDTTTTESFRAVAVTSDRSTVLAALTEQANAHFGHGPLLVTNIIVTPASLGDGSEAVYLAEGDFAIDVHSA